jgi:2-hydroxychromene-2-carboxylate isomerase
MRGAIVAERRGELERYSEAMFLAIWRDALDMDDPAVIGQALVKYGFDAKAYFAGTQEQAVKDDLKARTDAAIARGVFGLPTYFVGEKMWWGQDRLEWVKEALRA